MIIFMVLSYGCALLHLYASFISILQIDMDTIEVSNLNRQFLFRQFHVGQSKAKVSETVMDIIVICIGPSCTTT